MVGIKILDSVLEKVGEILRPLIHIKKNAEAKRIFVLVDWNLYSRETKLSSPNLYGKESQNRMLAIGLYLHKRRCDLIIQFSQPTSRQILSPPSGMRMIRKSYLLTQQLPHWSIRQRNTGQWYQTTKRQPPTSPKPTPSKRKGATRTRS